MVRRLLRFSATAVAIAWLGAGLGCDPSSTTPGVVDTDGDGLSDIDEISLYGTSPVLADTDGDGLSDYDEVVQRAFDPVNGPHHFNPLVADVPLMNLRITSAPLVTVHLTDANGVTLTASNRVLQPPSRRPLSDWLKNCPLKLSAKPGTGTIGAVLPGMEAKRCSRFSKKS